MKKLATFISGRQPCGEGDRDGLLNRPEGIEELGSWHYLVVGRSITTRKVPAYDATNKTGVVYAEGTVLPVDQRIVCAWTRWLRVCDGGDSEFWLFDISPKDCRLRAVEVLREEGPWVVKAPAPLQTMPGPLLELPKRGMPPISEGAALTVTERLRLVGRTMELLRLDDGRWLQDLSGATGGKTRQAAEVGAWQYLALEGGLRPCHRADDIKLSDGNQERAPVSGAESSARAEEASPSDRRGRSIPEGCVLQVVERRPGADALLLRLSDGSWVPDVVGSRHNARASLTEAEVEISPSSYVVVAARGIAIRGRPSFNEGAKIAEGPGCGETVACSESIRCGGTCFLKMANGRGWLFDVNRHGKRVMDAHSHSAGEYFS